MKSADIHWLAGYLEGEGCFGHYNRRRSRDVAGERRDGSRGGSQFVLMVSVGSTDLDVIERAATLMRGHVYARKKIRGRKRDWTVHIGGPRAAGLMMTLLPLMGARRAKRIKEALAAWRATKTYPERSPYLRALRGKR